MKHEFESRPKVSVIIPVRDRADYLELCLRYLTSQTLPLSVYEILVVNDGSTDDSALRASKFGATVINSEPRGPSHARNVGVASAQGDIIVFLDSDMLVNPDFIQSHIRLHSFRSPAVVIGARRFLTKDERVISGNYRRDSREVLLDRHSYEINYLKHPWSIAYTCNISAPATIARQAMFDESFTGWGLEDIDWAYNLHNLGVKWVFSRTVMAYHLHHDRASDQFEQWKINLERFLSKHPRGDAQKFKVFESVFDPSVRNDYMTVYDTFNESSAMSESKVVVDISAYMGDAYRFVEDVSSVIDERNDLIVIDSLEKIEQFSVEADSVVPTTRAIRHFTAEDWERVNKS